MLPAAAMRYVLLAMEGTPAVLDSLLREVAHNDPLWDFRPDPERFTLREAAAHLADWEPIFLERVLRIRDEEKPFLPDIDEGQLAITNDYAHSDAHASLRRFREGRAKLSAALRALPAEAWTRMGHRDKIGDLTLEDMAVFVVAHDGYHTRQVAEWLAAPSSR